MNNAKAVAALNTISLAFGELAEALTENVTAPVVARPSAIVDDGPPTSRLEAWAEEDIAPQGSLVQCPSHKAKFMAGKYGPYCPALSDEPAWANRKGYCTITPETAVDWLRQHAA